ncbi:TetR/AcrR family transcriptional regulator [Streptomyces sp. V4-01]|uniref:TetR/AcrR family transcriptional regulator n=1 Tax=Actinacidiphila polyblastidii TaxID=3110430 RepID=A0ABU7PKR3_9ACTN|nr:TetR/AcrR family transcriptional regulator [Streptomyces sp. V4-01]
MVEQTRTGPPRGAVYGGQSREERAADRRARISQAALELFAARAYEDVTVAEVCDRAKVSKRYFYEHFSDREDLLLAVHRQQNDWLLAGAAAAAPPDPEDLDALLRPIMTTVVTMLTEHPDSAHVIYINAPRMEVRRRGVQHRNAELLGRLVSRSVPLPRDRMRHERMLLAVVAGVTEVIIDWLERGMEEESAALADHLTAFATATLSASTL